MSTSQAFVTLATNDAYALGALVLAESIRQVGTKAKLVVLISNHLSDTIKQALETSFDELVVVEELNSNDSEHLKLLARPELGITFTKINCWLLEQYTKCVFLDSDCVVLRPIDDLFEREEFSAAPDAGWPDCFNSGVFVYQPSKETFRKLMNFASQQNSSFDGGDQGLLNDFFSSWRSGDISRHLPFTYNVTANAFYSYLPAVTRFRNDIHVVHFAGATKPWQLTYNPQNEQLSGNSTGQSDVQRDFLLSWWRIMHRNVWPKLSKFNKIDDSNNQSAFHQQNSFGQYSGSLNYGNLTSNRGVETGSAAHRRAWEAGHIDYFGRDSFSNIQQQLERNIAHLPQQYHPSQPRQILPEKTVTTKESSIPLQQITNLPKTSSKGTTLSSSTQQVTNSTKQSTTPITVTQKIIEEIPKVTVGTQKTIPEGPKPTVVTQNVTPEVPKPTVLTQKIITESPKPTVATQHVISKSTVVTQKIIEEAPKTTVATQNVISKPTVVTQKIIEEAPKTTVLSQKLLNEKTSTPLLGHSPSTLLSHDQTTSHIPESNWTVKSTIVTSYSQGVGNLTGPTSISKVVSETYASSSDDVPTITSIKQKKDATILPGNDLTVKKSNEHFAWLFDKIFVAITYTISLCYLVFLVVIRRSNNSSMTHDNGTSLRGLTQLSTKQQTENRMKK
ncbi:hypothetical protein I4U23_017360 [Adineta vaga]|nr:hypothetical protein I4U23_017360 [Adineta vaga]